jgi:hypothetical protein
MYLDRLRYQPAPAILASSMPELLLERGIAEIFIGCELEADADGSRIAVRQVDLEV